MSHRPTGSPALSTDAHDVDLRPDPQGAQTAAELIRVMRLYRLWAGEPSFRDMVRRLEDDSRTGQQKGSQSVRVVSSATLCTLLRGERLPRLDNLRAFIVGCGGGDQDVHRFTKAWQSLRLAEDAGLPLPDGRTSRRSGAS